MVMVFLQALTLKSMRNPSRMVIEVSFGTPQYQATVQLRKLVLHEPMLVDFTREELAEEINSFHFACIDQNSMVMGCLIMQPIDADTVEMKEVAVLEDYRSSGVGTAMVSFVERWAKERGFKKISLAGWGKSINFYTKKGYRKVGKSFRVNETDHYKMEKSL